MKSDDEAIKLVSDIEYKLTSAIFTKDLQRAFKIAKSIESEAVHINVITIHDEPNLPHREAKSNGFGRFNSLLRLRE